MNKQTICALIFGLAGLSANCNNKVPIQLLPEGGRAIVVPAECAKVTNFSFNYSSPYWQLNCEDPEGKHIFYGLDYTNNESWIRYEFVRESDR